MIYIHNFERIIGDTIIYVMVKKKKIIKKYFSYDDVYYKSNILF